jgi:hypothetical protein
MKIGFKSSLLSFLKTLLLVLGKYRQLLFFNFLVKNSWQYQKIALYLQYKTAKIRAWKL